MTRLCALAVLAMATAASAAEVTIDDFEGPVAWTVNADGGAAVPTQTRIDTDHVRQGKAALRLTYTDAAPHWSNLQRPVTVPPSATAIAVWLRVHSAAPKAAMHYWLIEPDGDSWVARIGPRSMDLSQLAQGWHRVVVPVSAFRFDPRGTKTRQMHKANRMLVGCNFGSLDVTLDHLRFITSKEGRVATMARTEKLAFESGPHGRVAILADDLPTTAGSAKPDAVAALARTMGFGVTMLKAGDAADPTVLSRKHFDVLVVPCAPAYPRQGRKALLRFLKAGGSLVSIGGYAFDNPLVKTPDGWAAIDPTIRAVDMNQPRPVSEWINTRYGAPGDTMRLQGDQIGAFDPSYRLEHVARAMTAPDQAILKDALFLKAPLTGYAACAMTGSNSPVFPKVYGRWIPLLNTYDRLGRLRGAAASVVHHWSGPFAGSSWALLGVDNHDLVAECPSLFTTALLAVTEKTYLHGLATQWACYRAGEPVKASVAVTNHGPSERTLTVTFGGDGLKTARCKLTVAPGATATAEATLHKGAFDRDFYTVAAILSDSVSGKSLDRMTSAFVVWDDKVVQAGPKLELKDNYFNVNGTPRFVCGTNQTGMMWHSEHEDPLVWERDFAKMEATGMRMLRILHFSPFAADDPPRWRTHGPAVLRNRPEKLLRQTDAIVQLAQKHGVAIFLTLHDWMPVALSDADLAHQRDWNQFWAHRYRNVPGILYDVQNEPSVRITQEPDLVRFHNEWLKARYGTWDALRAAWGKAAPTGKPWTLKPGPGSKDWADVKALDANRFLVATLNRWVKANVEGVKAGDPDALVAVGYLSSQRPADKVLGVAHTDFSNMHSYNLPPTLVSGFKLIDRRFVGKSFSLGEFGAREAHDARTHGTTGTMPQASIRRFLATTHYALGLGASMALNWDWKDFDDAVFPWGLCHHCDLVSKPVAVAFRNTSLFLGRLRPRYQDPGVYLLLPDSHRLGGRWHEVHAAIARTIDALVASHVDFNVANEDDLDKLPPTCRAIVWPVPYCPSDAAFARVLAFVRAGGALYLSGDVAYDPRRHRTRAKRLADLGLKDTGARQPFAKAARQAPDTPQQATVGKGKVFYVARPIELTDGPVTQRVREFLAFAGERRIAVKPDDPKLHVFTLPLADGSATVVCNQTASAQNVRLASAQLAVGEGLTGLVATTAEGAVTQIECTGRSTAGGQPITSGTAHVMLASLDGRDIRQSTRLALFPITTGTLTLYTTAAWRRPVVEAGEFHGPTWHTLAAVPLKAKDGTLTVDIDPALARSLLVLRERDAETGLR